jgi:hypothetical protein
MEFDVNNIKQPDMNRLADDIEEYMIVLNKVMIIPEDMRKECEPLIKEGKKRTEKLIKKLRKGDKSIFKDEDEWNPLN